MTATQYLENKSKRENTLFRIKPDGTCCYVCKGLEVNQKEFERLHPLPVTRIVPPNPYFKGENSDRRSDWLKD